VFKKGTTFKYRLKLSTADVFRSLLAFSTKVDPVDLQINLDNL